MHCTVGSTSSPNWLKWHEIMNPDLEIPNGVHKSATFPGWTRAEALASHLHRRIFWGGFPEEITLGFSIKLMPWWEAFYNFLWHGFIVNDGLARTPHYSQIAYKSRFRKRSLHLIVSADKIYFVFRGASLCWIDIKYISAESSSSIFLNIPLFE